LLTKFKISHKIWPISLKMTARHEIASEIAGYFGETAGFWGGWAAIASENTGYFEQAKGKRANRPFFMGYFGGA